MSKIISGDAAYQRWNLPEVAGERSAVPVQQQYLRADHLEKIQKQAYDEAYAQGLKDGLAAGQAQIKSSAQRLTQLTGKLADLLGGLDQAVEQELLEYVMLISRLILRRELQSDRDYLANLINEGLSVMPLSCRNVKVALHPEDAEWLKSHAALPASDKTWHIVEDRSLARGDCRIVSDSSRVDATLDQRLAAIEQALFKKDA